MVSKYKTNTIGFCTKIKQQTHQTPYIHENWTKRLEEEKKNRKHGLHKEQMRLQNLHYAKKTDIK